MTNATAAATRDDHRGRQHERALVGHRREVDREDERRRRAAPRGCRPGCRPGSVVSFTCAGTNRTRQHQRDRGERQRDEEHRAPPEVLEQRAGDQRAERGDGAAECRPQRDRLACAPGPDHSAVMSASVVGYAMPAERPPTSRATNSTTSVGAHAATRHAGTESEHAERPASSCGRSGRRARRATAPTPRGRASSRPR